MNNVEKNKNRVQSEKNFIDFNDENSLVEYVKGIHTTLKDDDFKFVRGQRALALRRVAKNLNIPFRKMNIDKVTEYIGNFKVGTQSVFLPTPPMVMKMKKNVVDIRFKNFHFSGVFVFTHGKTNVYLLTVSPYIHNSLSGEINISSPITIDELKFCHNNIPYIRKDVALLPTAFPDNPIKIHNEYVLLTLPPDLVNIARELAFPLADYTKKDNVYFINQEDQSISLNNISQVQGYPLCYKYRNVTKNGDSGRPLFMLKNNQVLSVVGIHTGGVPSSGENEGYGIFIGSNPHFH